MIVVSVFVLLVLFYCLVSKRLERTLLSALVSTRNQPRYAPQPQELRIERRSFLLQAEIGLVMFLFTDATHINLKTLKSKNQCPLRLLTIDMLLTIPLGTLCGRLLFPDISFWEAGILAAILAPTDAGLGQVIVQSPRVPQPIRRALDVEAGLNDGLSVPFLLFLIAIAQYGTAGAGQILGDSLSPSSAW